MLMSASRRWCGLTSPSRARRAVVEQHHVVLDHPQPAGLGVAAGAGRVFHALQLAPVLHVGAAAVESGLLVVPEREADRHGGLDVRRAEDARQLHHQRGARRVVVGPLAEAVAVHVRAEDVHLAGARGADLRAVDLRTLPVGGLLQVQRAQRFVGLGHWIADDAGRPPVAEHRAAPRSAPVAAYAPAGRSGPGRVERGVACGRGVCSNEAADRRRNDAARWDSRPPRAAPRSSRRRHGCAGCPAGGRRTASGPRMTAL